MVHPVTRVDQRENPLAGWLNNVPSSKTLRTGLSKSLLFLCYDVGQISCYPALMKPLKYLQGYPPDILRQIQAIADQGKLGRWLTSKYPDRHDIQSDKSLYQYVDYYKRRYVRNASSLSKVYYDNKQNPITGTLGTNTFVSRVQGGKLKANNEIRIATLFRDAPEAFLRMIVVHELAHLKEKEHNKAFYQLCCHMEPDYHQLEFDMRLWLNWRDQQS